MECLAKVIWNRRESEGDKGLLLRDTFESHPSNDRRNRLISRIVGNQIKIIVSKKRFIRPQVSCYLHYTHECNAYEISHFFSTKSVLKL